MNGYAHAASHADQRHWGGPTEPMSDRWIDPEATPSERTYALWTHLSSGLFFVTGLIVIQALVLWLIRRNDSPFLDDHGREALHFQLSLVIYAIGFSVVTLGIGFLVAFPALIVLGVVGTIRAAKAANRGEYYRYPMTLRFF